MLDWSIPLAGIAALSMCYAIWQDLRPVVAMSPDQPTHLHKLMCPGVSLFDELTRSLEESASVHTSVDVLHRSMESFWLSRTKTNATHSDLSCFVSFSGTSHTYKDWRKQLRQWYFFLLQALPRRYFDLSGVEGKESLKQQAWVNRDSYYYIEP